MSLSTAIYSELTSDADISGAVGTKVFPSIAPRSASHPYIVYNIISGQHTHHMTGGSGLTKRRLQFDIYATTEASVDSIADDLRELLDFFRGDMGTENLSVRVVMLVDEQSSISEASDGSETHIYKRIMDFEVWHTESVTG